MYSPEVLKGYLFEDITLTVTKEELDDLLSLVEQMASE